MTLTLEREDNHQGNKFQDNKNNENMIAAETSLTIIVTIGTKVMESTMEDMMVNMTIINLIVTIIDHPFLQEQKHKMN